MILVDSNIFIAAFRKEENNHAKAMDLIMQADEIILLDYVLGEVGTVLLYKEGKSVANKVMDFLTKSENIHIVQLNNNELVGTIDAFNRQSGKLSFVDMALFVVASQRKIKLITFDFALNKMIKQ